MGHKYDGTITVKDTLNISATIPIMDIPAAGSPDMTKMLALATSLKSHLNGGIVSYALLDWEDTLATDATTPTGVNSDKALILYEWADAGDIVHYERLILPNPNVATHFEPVEGEGYRMLAASMTSLGTLLSTASGLTITVNEGKLIHQSGRKVKGATSIGFKDSIKQTAWMQFSYATTAAALTTLANAIATGQYSLSKVTVASFLTKTEVLPDQSSGIGLAAVDADAMSFTTVETRAFLTMSYLEGDIKKFMRFLMPSIKNSDCVIGTGKDDWKLTKAVGDGVALSLVALFGSANKNVGYVRCSMKVKDLKSV